MSHDIANCPELCPRLMELKECGLDYRIVEVAPDRLRIIVVNGDPEPFLMDIPLNQNSRSTH